MGVWLTFMLQDTIVSVALQCVRMAVLMAEPNSEVFEVKHTGFVVLQPQQSTSKHPAHSTAVAGHHQAAVNWRLTSMPGETGVLWLEDD